MTVVSINPSHSLFLFLSLQKPTISNSKFKTVAASTMVALGTSAPENLNIPEQMQQEETMADDDSGGSEISDYELCREERIRENRERMQKLGIFDLSNKLNALKSNPARATRRKATRLHSPLPPSSPGPVRRSSRLQSSTPVTYCEIREKKDKSAKEINILREVGAKPEFYTEEHDKVLGNTEMSWTLFVDGYGNDGKRIYDPVKGKTCHQCRQKTLGQRTHCSNCNMVQGQFCGDCLYMRYGENVLEANANPQWTCPVCRGICNCSLCRQAKGWHPTGMLYKKISSLGYKSVAHYLIQTRRANTDAENNVGSKVPVSAKRSLPFSDIEVTGEEDDDLSKPGCEVINPDTIPVSDEKSGARKLVPEPLQNPADADLMKDEVEYPAKLEHEEDSAGCEEVKENILLTGSELDKSSSIIYVTVVESSNEVIIPEAPERGGEAFAIEKESSVEDRKDVVASETSLSSKKRACCEPKPDSIGARLRRRRNEVNTTKELQFCEIEKENSVVDKGTVASDISRKTTKKRAYCLPTQDSIGGRLRRRRNEANMCKELQLVNVNLT